MKKKIFKRGMAGLLAVLTAFTTLIGMGTTAFICLIAYRGDE